MGKSWLMCVLLGALAWGQAAPGAPPAAQAARAPADTSACCSADAAVITVIGVCPSPPRRPQPNRHCGQAANPPRLPQQKLRMAIAKQSSPRLSLKQLAKCHSSQRNAAGKKATRRRLAALHRNVQRGQERRHGQDDAI